MRRLIGWLMAVLTVMGWWHFNYSSGEECLEVWLMRRGFSDLESILIESVIFILMASATFLLLRSDYDPREWSH